MPYDLISYKEELESDPSSADFLDQYKFQNCSVHVMKLHAHSYYLKNMVEIIETEESEPE